MGGGIYCGSSIWIIWGAVIATAATPVCMILGGLGYGWWREKRGGRRLFHHLPCPDTLPLDKLFQIPMIAVITLALAVMALRTLDEFRASGKRMKPNQI